MVTHYVNTGNEKKQQSDQQGIGYDQHLAPIFAKPLAENRPWQESCQKNSDNQPDLVINIAKKYLECKYHQDFTAHGQTPGGQKDELLPGDEEKINPGQHRDQGHEQRRRTGIL